MNPVSLAPRGRTFTRAVAALALGKDFGDSVSIAEARFDDDTLRIVKAAAAAGTLGGWGAELGRIAGLSEFFGLVQQQTLLGRLSGVAAVPLNTRLLALTGGATAYWVGEGKPKPLTQLQLTAQELPPMKVAAQIVFTKELARLADAKAEARFTADLTRACVELSDSSFIDPANAGSAGVKPASITNAATPVVSNGVVLEDIPALITAFTGNLETAYFITNPYTATQLALSRDSGGGYNFPDVGPRGGSLLGIPVLTSRSVPTGVIVLLDASALAYGSEGVRVSRSEAGTVEMETAPASPVDATTVQISLWQNDLVGVLVEIAQNWKLEHAGAVAVLTGADYGAVTP